MRDGDRNDVQWMRQAIRFARKGIGTASPNPVVGAVIVKNGRKIGAGWHEKAGEPHAEINAVRSLPDERAAKGAVLYVTLEPCSTTGRTPPCCDAIIRCGFKRVVIGCTDPNPKHSGRGVKLLKKAGIEVTENVCQEECRALNEAFFKWIIVKRPFVVLKMAETLDGKIASKSGVSQWITGTAARRYVMKLRMQADAILAGANTFRLDSPSFTVRDAKGKVLKTPRRIIVSHKKLALPDGWEQVRLDSGADWDNFLAKLAAENVTFLLIEGGGELAASALNAGIVDKAEFFIAPKILGGKGSRPCVGGPDPADLAGAISIDCMTCRKVGDDFLMTGYPVKAGR